MFEILHYATEYEHIHKDLCQKVSKDTNIIENVIEGVSIHPKGKFIK